MIHNILMKYYLIGKNIESSLSPKIHNYLFQLKQRKSTYQPPISQRLFSLREMQEESFGGMSITMPYKKLFSNDIHIRKEGQLSSKHGIINTIYKNTEKQLIGFNTDLFGVSQCLKSKSQLLQQRNAVIIGAGATAEIFCYFMELNNIKTSFINRSSKEQIKSRFSNIVDFLPLRTEPVHLKTALTYSIIINTLPSELVYNNWDAIEQNLQNMFQVYSKKYKNRIIYFDVNYRAKLDPIQQLLKNKLNLSVEVLHGIDMLIWQAIQQNRCFCLEEEFHPEQYQWQMNKIRKELNLS